MTGDPFDLDDAAAYRRWREGKLDTVARTVQDLLVEVGDPMALRAGEREALLERCARTNMAVYRSPRVDADSAIPRRIGEQLGLLTLDVNYLADDDGITSLSVAQAGTRSAFIPYTDRPIRWHTDGYYNPPRQRIRAMILHCVQRAESGGENRLLDHELAYIALRDIDPGHVRALMLPEAMTIPARSEEGGTARGDQTGPVFSVDADGSLHMRYTARTRSITWKDDPAVRAATAALEQVLQTSPYVLRLRQEPGMGIVCNNVLHDRSAFSDSPLHRRLVLRARFYERIAAPLAARDRRREAAACAETPRPAP